MVKDANNIPMHMFLTILIVSLVLYPSNMQDLLEVSQR